MDEDRILRGRRAAPGRTATRWHRLHTPALGAPEGPHRALAFAPRRTEYRPPHTQFQGTTLELIEYTPPALGDNDVFVDVKYCGMCHR